MYNILCWKLADDPYVQRGKTLNRGMDMYIGNKKDQGKE